MKIVGEDANGRYWEALLSTSSSVGLRLVAANNRAGQYDGVERGRRGSTSVGEAKGIIVSEARSEYSELKSCMSPEDSAHGGD